MSTEIFSSKPRTSLIFCQSIDNREESVTSFSPSPLHHSLSVVDQRDLVYLSGKAYLNKHHHHHLSIEWSTRGTKKALECNAIIILLLPFFLSCFLFISNPTIFVAQMPGLLLFLMTDVDVSSDVGNEFNAQNNGSRERAKRKSEHCNTHTSRGRCITYDFDIDQHFSPRAKRTSPRRREREREKEKGNQKNYLSN